MRADREESEDTSRLMPGLYRVGEILWFVSSASSAKAKNAATVITETTANIGEFQHIQARSIILFLTICNP